MPRHITVLVALTVLAAPAWAQTVPTRVRGTVQKIEGDTLVIDGRDGDIIPVHLAPAYTVSAVVPASLADAKPGSFIGAAATGPRDHLRALEVLIFPEAARGSGEGHYPWDLKPESTMTNATVESEVTGGTGRVLTLVAKGEKLEMTVPPDAPVVTFEPGTQAMLVPGAHVFIGAQKAADGTLTANRVNVGKDGLTPPM